MAFRTSSFGSSAALLALDEISRAFIEKSRSERLSDADIYTRDSEVCVEAELPGIDPADVSVEAENGWLKVKVAEQATGEDGSDFFWKSRSQRDRSFSVELGKSFDYEAAQASFKNGLLTVKIPKLAKEAPKKIELSVS